MLPRNWLKADLGFSLRAPVFIIISRIELGGPRRGLGKLNNARRDLFKRMGAVAAAIGLAGLLPGSASAETEAAAGTSASATVRVILANATSVQWMAVTSAGLTVGGQTTLVPGGKLNANIVKGAVAAIIAGGGSRLTTWQIILLGGQS